MLHLFILLPSQCYSAGHESHPLSLSPRFHSYWGCTYHIQPQLTLLLPAHPQCPGQWQLRSSAEWRPMLCSVLQLSRRWVHPGRAAATTEGGGNQSSHRDLSRSHYGIVSRCHPAIVRSNSQPVFCGPTAAAAADGGRQRAV